MKGVVWPCAAAYGALVWVVVRPAWRRWILTEEARRLSEEDPQDPLIIVSRGPRQRRP
ncbi:MAG TPA: hypothetical protein VMC86_11170 [Gemmatimonadales bacterium]|nr:hypothetical protein [Gemmatimonadales bacterium]